MMEKLRARGDVFAKKAACKRVDAVADELRAGLPDHIDVVREGEDVIVDSPHPLDDLVEHAALRDVAFLMRSAK